MNIKAASLLALSLLSALGLSGALLVACSSKDSTTTTTTTGSSSSGAPQTHYCDNAADEAARLKGYCPDSENIQDISGDCGVMCIMAVDAGDCVTSCILAATQNALSAPCAGCVADTVVCARDHCLNECVSDPTGKVCLVCRCGGNAMKYNCYDDYERCAGKHLTDCDELDAGTWDGYPHPDAGCSDAAGE